MRPPATSIRKAIFWKVMKEMPSGRITCWKTKSCPLRSSTTETAKFAYLK